MSETADTIFIPIEQLYEPYYNPRKHPEKQVYNLSLSLKEFGQRRTISVWPDGKGKFEVLAGNGIKRAAELAKLPGLNCTLAPADWPEIRRKAYSQADNQGGYEDDQLAIANILQEVLNDSQIPLEALGSSQEELDALLEMIAEDALAGGAGNEPGAGGDEFDADKEEIPERCRPGDLWQLGEHRLLVSDCTNKAEVSRLFKGEKASAVITSPPYTDQREYKIGEFNWQSLMCGSFDQMIANASKDCHILVNLGLSHKNRKVDMYWNGWFDYAASKQWPLFGWYIWDKGSGAPGEWNGRLAPAHEFVFHFNQECTSANKWIETTGESAERGTSGKRFRQKDGTLRELTSPDKIGQPFKVPDSVIRINREMARGIHTQNHPAVFPVAFPEYLINTWTQPGQIVYEPFCGSGTTIIAAERTGRRCYGCELEPKYADVILERYIAETGIEPKLLDRVAEDQEQELLT